MYLALDANNGIPLGVQIVAGIRMAIAAQRLRPGDQLPSARDLAAELHVNFHTVRKAPSRPHCSARVSSASSCG
jgi:GntR family transcriptional regulator